MRCYPGLIVGVLLTHILSSASSAQPPAIGWDTPSALPSGDPLPDSHPRFPLPSPLPTGAPFGVQPSHSSATVEQLPAVPQALAESPAAATSPAQQQALVSTGQVAFEKACIICHDADKALSKRKNLTQ